ncbi:hypothetical protein [Streptomyces sp. NPDC058451]|uniref:hypothetical protein n=1 Tax=Streptomyces sp. NPDC058451 TaxID=3346506 RepID=UPI0036697A06
MAAPTRATRTGVLAHSADVPWGWLERDLTDTDDRPAPPQASQTLTATDPHGRTWRIDAATNFQISPSSPGQIWEASCSALTTTTPILSARQVAERIKDVPA